VIFLCCRVKFPVINAHSPTRDGSLQDKLIFIILNDHHASLLGHNLNGAYPLAMWHGIDYPGMQELKDLGLNDFPRCIVKPMLTLPRWSTSWVYRDAMCAKGRTDPFEILE
jgi:hypothetical protein